MKRTILFLICIFLCHVQSTAAQESKLFEGDKSVLLIGEPGKESDTRTIKFLVPNSADEKAKLTPIASHLKREDGLSAAIIDRSNVQVDNVSANGEQGYATFQVKIKSLPEKYGGYRGDIEFVGSDKKVIYKIIVELHIVPSPSFLPKVDKPKISLTLKSGKETSLSGLEMHFGIRSTVKARVTVIDLPEGIEIEQVRSSLLLASEGQNIFGAKPKVTKVGTRKIDIEVDASSASPGKYSGLVEVIVGKTARVIPVTLDVSVRAAPWLAVFVVLIGILIGKLSRFAIERGDIAIRVANAVADLRQRFAAMGERGREGLRDTLRDTVLLLFSSGEFLEAEKLLPDMRRRIELALECERLEAWAKASGRTDLDADINQFFRDLGGKPIAALEKAMTDLSAKKAPQNDMANDDDAAKKEPERRWIVSLDRGSLLVLAARAARATLGFATLLLVAWIGFETFYLKADTAFGANAGDYLNALIWGLSADVASRTITTLANLRKA